VIKSNKAKIKDCQNQLLIAKKKVNSDLDEIKKIQQKINYYQKEIATAKDPAESNKAKMKDYQNKLLIANEEVNSDSDMITKIQETIDYHQREIATAENTDKSNVIILNNERISCYFPKIISSSDQINFKYGKLHENISSESSESSESSVEELSKQAQELHINNTCRTTALNIVEKILGFKTNISQNFFIAPNYETTLIAGQPNKESFYILPPPPEAYGTDKTCKNSWLRILYDRLNETPKTNPSSDKTRKKFNALKEIYNSYAVKKDLNLDELLRLIESNMTDLNAKRNSGFLNNLYSSTSRTETMLKPFKAHLEQLKNQEKKTDGKNDMNGMKGR
jgi:hypothetical protein